MRRVLSPLVLAAMAVNGVLIVNQELIVPRFAYYALEGRGVSSKQGPPVESAYDHLTRITIDGKQLLPAERAIQEAEFVLPAPTIVEELTTLRAEEGRLPARAGKRSDGLVSVRDGAGVRRSAAHRTRCRDPAQRTENPRSVRGDGAHSGPALQAQQQLFDAVQPRVVAADRESGVRADVCAPAGAAPSPAVRAAAVECDRRADHDSVDGPPGEHGAGDRFGAVAP